MIAWAAVFTLAWFPPPGGSDAVGNAYAALLYMALMHLLGAVLAIVALVVARGTADLDSRWRLASHVPLFVECGLVLFGMAFLLFD